MSEDRDLWLDTDAADARLALEVAAQIASLTRSPSANLLPLATKVYRWLRSRDSLKPVSLLLVPGTPHKEGTPMATVFNLSDTDQVTFSLAGQDAKGAGVPLPDGFTAAWALADPDASGATLTVSADTTTATVAAGVPDTNLLLSVVVTTPDGSTLNGAEAIVVQATAATTVNLVPGTPVPEG